MINPKDHKQIVFFTGAGMSAESGVPTYRGKGGVWSRYNYEDYACREAFERHPEKVLKFHELRRKAALKCKPHDGHTLISRIEQVFPHVTVVTQNVDGMHQRAGSRKVIELHGSLWRLRCPDHGISEDIGETYKSYSCEKCGGWLRPDIVWFGDALDREVIREATNYIGTCDLFISIGTSGVVHPAAGFPSIANANGALCIEINPEATPLSYLFNKHIREPAGTALFKLFPQFQQQ